MSHDNFCTNIFFRFGFFCVIQEFSVSSKFLSFFTVLQSEVIDLNDPNNPLQITAINTSTINGFGGPAISMTIPLELLRAFSDGNGVIRIVSAVYRNIAAIFSDDIKMK